jgi:hypothetical protein
MPEQTPRTLPWLERLALYIPGYGGYLDRGNRRSADKALRDAIAGKLGGLRKGIEGAIRACIDRGALSEINALERSRQQVDRIASRLQSAGSGTDDFYGAGALDAAKADPLHALDHQLYTRSEDLAAWFDRKDDSPDLLANLEAGLDEFEKKLDERALLLQGIR